MTFVRGDDSDMKKDKAEDSISETKPHALSYNNSFPAKYGPYLIMGGLIIYVILLTIGTIAEIFNIQSILDWWIWSPPGK
jgi:hypothetical protein